MNLKKRTNKKLVLVIVLAVLTAALAIFAFMGPRSESGTPVQQPEKTYTVRFLGPDDSLVYEDQVMHGEAAEPPANPVMPQGYVFSSWDSDFSAVTENMTVRAICTQISGLDNVLSLAGGYAVQGEGVTLPLQLSGNVCLCALDIRIRYDNQALDFVEFSYQDGAVDANCIEEDGVIYLNYASHSNTIGEVDLAGLVFTAIGEAGKTNVEIEIVEVIAFDDEFEFYVPEATAIPAEVSITAG